MENLLLAGDVGGTKTVLVALRPGAGAGGPSAVADATYENRHYAGLDAIVADFVDRHGLRARWAGFSVAGPVADGRTVLTNLGWELDAARIARTFDFGAVHLLNDLQATAYSIPGLPPDRLCTLQEGMPAADRLRAVIAPGTGLGEAFLVWDGTRVETWASEGGNADFAPGDETQLELLRFMQARIGHVSYELVCAGIGIPNIYRFLKESGREAEPAWLADRIAAAPDPTPVIAEGALRDDPSPICARTMQLFVAILGAEAGNMALRLLSAGGVYVGGGIPPRILPLLRDGRFMRAFRDKGRFASLMETFPVHVILDPRAAVFGAAEYALAQLASHGALRRSPAIA